MPPVGPRLSAAEIAALRSWIDAGAVWPEDHSASPKALSPGAGRPKPWSFAPLKRPAVPSVEGARNPIDAFILARLAKEEVAPSVAAAPHTVLRRVSLDLTGLPPTPVELEAFVSDSSPNAY